MKPVAAKPGSPAQLPSRIEKETKIVSVATILILLTVVGGGFGLVGSIVGGLSIESWVEAARPAGPRLSYGQQAGMIIFPLCALIGAATGFSVGIAFCRFPFLALIMLLATSFCGWGITSSMWSSQIANYGPDPSEMVLYYPPTTMSILALSSASIIVVVVFVRFLLRIISPARTPEKPVIDKSDWNARI